MANNNIYEKNILLVLSVEQKLKKNSSITVSMVRNAKSHKFLNDELNGKAGSKHQCRRGAWYTEVLQNNLKQENPIFCNFLAVFLHSSPAWRYLTLDCLWAVITHPETCSSFGPWHPGPFTKDQEGCATSAAFSLAYLDWTIQSTWWYPKMLSLGLGEVIIWLSSCCLKTSA